MTDRVLNVLRQMKDGAVVDFDADDDELQDLLDALHKQGLIRHFIDGSAMLEPNGRPALIEAEEALSTKQQRAKNEMREQRAAQRAEEERRIREKREDRRHSWKVAIIGAIIAGTVVLLIGKYLVH